jgi:hypothetical protein
VIYVPVPAYPPPPAGYYPPPPPPPVYYGPAPTYGSYDPSSFNGGVGYGEAAGGGGIGGVVTLANGGDQDAPPNGGGVNLPAGYGPNYLGQWQGDPVPTRGGLAKH